MKEHIGVESPFLQVTVDGVNLAYSDEGLGQPVICLHATAQGGRDFMYLRSKLRSISGIRVIVLDWPGHGRSGDDHEAFSAERCERLLLKFLDQLHIDRPLLIGNSIGGAAALRFAHAHPDRVKAVVACNPGGLAPINWVARIFCSFMARVAVLGRRNSPLFKPIFGLFCRALLRGPAAAEQRKRIIAAGKNNALVMQQAWVSFMQPSGDIRWMMPEIQRPVLFAWAKDDAVVSLKTSKAAIKRVPNHSLQLFSGGHCAYLEAPDEFFTHLCNFLDRLRTSQLDHVK
ncbi:alpha/beta hydrolase [Limnobacter humi]|uniref:Alpha/beta hydrolase n=1 Tax=Limnobacter humi TaxID=1778671 RepID=A0ABT1WG49_9BURK|nr:alpha/beta hydrolase [Limnobacter humi]MCQ8896490.1 alpha/beta hydrolase [Limnobacter humi]